MGLILKAPHSVTLPCEERNGNGELAFTLDDYTKVDELFLEWQTKGINIISPPSQVTFGYIFVAFDPDGHRLRVAAFASEEYVRSGRAQSFMQVCHGKAAPLRHLKPNDWVVYYSPKVAFGSKDKLQSLTAIGRIKESGALSSGYGEWFLSISSSSTLV